MIKVLLILAGSLKEFEALTRNPPPGTEGLYLRYVTDSSSILDTIPEETRFLNIGTCWNLKDYDQIRNELRQRKILLWGEAPMTEEDIKQARERLKKYVTSEKLTIHQMGKTPHLDSNAPWIKASGLKD